MAKSFIKLQKLLSSIDLRLDDMFDFGWIKVVFQNKFEKYLSSNKS